LNNYCTILMISCTFCI